jgi:hypothetical protein
MKLILLSALLLPAVLMAQAPQPGAPAMRQRIIPPQGSGAQQSSEMLPDNYQITLNITDKDGAPLELSVVVASAQFNAMFGEQSLGFGGYVKVEESGSIMVNYSLDWQTTVGGAGSMQYVPSRMQGSVRLKLGEEVQIIRAGTRSARLSIQKLDAVKGKGK